MAVANVIRVSLQGSMPNGEKWSVNPVWQIGGVSTAEDVSPEQCLTMATAIDAITISGGITGLWPSSVAITGNRVEARRWDGTLSAQAEHARTPVVGTNPSAIHPFQTAIVLSLRTGGVGASGRGRLYWPANGVVLVGATMRPATSTITTALAGIKTWLTSATAALDVTLTNSPVLSVWSRLKSSTQPVNSLQMGDVLDTQRRRRDSLVESYSSLSWP